MGSKIQIAIEKSTLMRLKKIKQDLQFKKLEKDNSFSSITYDTVINLTLDSYEKE